MLKLLRLIFPNAGWYVYWGRDFDTDRYGPYDTKQGALLASDFEQGVFSVWVEFKLE